ncbi:MAG: hypothetical protein IT561_11645 [Alphaproteobacteria bacterium]|nr:hypothetical protein [Alphaproteobacteria bacterium]
MRLAMIAVMLAAVATPAFAQSGTPGIDQRQANQERRIDQGAATGALSPRETRRLERHQARVDRMENRARRDGVVTRHERAHIRHSQNVESRRIARQKHDANNR